MDSSTQRPTTLLTFVSVDHVALSDCAETEAYEVRAQGFFALSRGTLFILRSCP